MPSQQFPQSEKFNCVFQLIKHRHNKAFIFSSVAPTTTTPSLPLFPGLPHVFTRLCAAVPRFARGEAKSGLLCLKHFPSIRSVASLFGFVLCFLFFSVCQSARPPPQSLKGLLIEAKGEFNGCLFRGLRRALPSLSPLHETTWNLL